MTGQRFGRLDIRPKQCGTCGGSGIGDTDVYPRNQCPMCNGSGRVYPAELVERIAAAVFAAPWHTDGTSVSRSDYTIAIAVLDALNREDK